MFAHGMTSAGLFMMAGFIYNRLHTFNMEQPEGIGEVHARLCLS
ncbi:MAG: hypothetical protein Q9N34_02665 [Aquificota bacterium]|nr:hypothetical protein [Aquificota bacterium]